MYLSLQVNLWVPVRVVEDDCVCRSEVDAQTSGSCGQHEDELFTMWTIVLINEMLREKERGGKKMN